MVDGPVDLSIATTPTLVRQYVNIKMRLDRDGLTLRARTKLTDRLRLLVREMIERGVLD